MSDHQAGTRAQLDEDGRYALAAGAQATARRNKPRWMVQLATLTLAIAGIVLIIGIGAQGKAKAQAQRETRSMQEIRDAIDELDVLSATQDDGGPTLIGDFLPNLLSTMETLARRAGIEDRLPTPRESTSDTAPGAVAKRYDYTLTSVHLDRLLEFVQLATERIDAMQVYSLRLRITRGRQQDGAWELNVVFQRWERDEA